MEGTETPGTLDIKTLTPEKLLKRLRNALQRDGDFPASAKVVSELKRLTSDPKTTANQITEVILKEPSLGTRVLHLVNSSFYQRAKPIMTVSQAVIQIGMKPLAELCSGLVLLQKFVPAARRGGPFASCLQKTICTSLLSSSLATQLSGTNESHNETGYLSGSFAELGTLLLAYYFPQVYETAVKRAKAKKQDVSQSIKELTGVSPLQLSVEVIDALKLPEFYKAVITSSINMSEGHQPHDEIDSPQTRSLNSAAKALTAAERISSVVVFNKDKAALDAVVTEVIGNCDIAIEALQKVLADLPNKFTDHCSTIEVNLGPLPEFVVHYTEPDAIVSPSEPMPTADRFVQFVEEIRQAIDSRESTSSIITTVMETLAWGLKFDRALLLLLSTSKNELLGRMMLGKSDQDPKSIRRPLLPIASPRSPDAVAFAESRPIFNGNSLFDDGWPIAVVPIGFGKRAIGVIYADRIATEETAGAELTDREKVAIGMLAELLDRSLSMQG